MKPTMKALRTVLKALSLLTVVGSCGLLEADFPEATITSPTGPITVAQNQTVTFTASSEDSVQYDSYRVNSFTWNFGDGTPSVLGTGPSGVSNHAYANPGVYTATLTVSYTVGTCTRPAFPSGCMQYSYNTLTETATRTITVLAPPSISSFTASPTTVAPGAASTLSWTTTNATSLSIAGIGTVTGTSKVVNPTATTTYTLTATNAAGSVTATTTVNVMALPTISSFTASPTTVAPGAASTLSWTTTNATSLSIAGIGTVTGTSKVVNPTATTTYTLTATNAAGSVTATTAVNVMALPTIGSFTASPTTVAPGAASTLSWTTTNATSLSIAGIGTVTGTSKVVNPTATTTYTLTATNAAGSVTATTTVNVMALPTISSFTASPTTVAPGAASTLSWTTTNATSLSISGIGTVTGTSKVVNPTATTTYTLTATNAAGSVTANVTVTAKSWVLKLKKDIVYVGTKEVAEVDAQGAVRITLVDHLGSPRFLVGPTGVLESTQKYLPFGESLGDPTSAAKFAKGFTNHEQTDPSGLIYMQARFYAPWYGRFLSPDPARDQHFQETQSWNIYSYVQNNPTMHIDPTGMVDVGLINTLSNAFSSWLSIKAAQAEAASTPESRAESLQIMKDTLSYAPLFVGVVEMEMATSGHGEGAAESRAESSSARGASTEAAMAREGITVEARMAEGAAARAGSGSSSAGVTREGIYQFADAKAGGKPYVGQSGDVPTRLDRHAAAGRYTTGDAVVTPVSGGKTAREVAEHRQIQTLTGGVPARQSPNVANKVDPIGPKRQELLKCH